MLEARAYFSTTFLRRKERDASISTIEEDNLSLPAPERKARHAQRGRFPRVRHLCNDEEGDPLYETTLQYAILKKEWQS